jgi:hypothetical protein
MGRYKVHNEHSLQRQLIRENEKHRPYTKLYAQEWEVKPGHPNCGKGDPVFKRPGFEEYLVVETKYLTQRSGHTACTSRHKSRKQVVKQARRYGAEFKKLHPKANIKVATYTNESGLRMLASKRKRRKRR